MHINVYICNHTVPGAKIKVWFRFMLALHESREKTQSKNPGKKPKLKLAHFYIASFPGFHAGEEEREPGTHCSCMRQVPLVTCILLHCNKITVNSAYLLKGHTAWLYSFWDSYGWFLSHKQLSMCKQCVPGSFLSTHALEPGNEANFYSAIRVQFFSSISVLLFMMANICSLVRIQVLNWWDSILWRDSYFQLVRETV